MALGLMAAASIFVTSSRVCAQPGQGPELEYDLDPTLHGCPEATEMRALLSDALASVAYRETAHLRVRVGARLLERGIEGTIDWQTSNDGRSGQRRFPARNQDCRELMASMAFALAVQLELMAGKPGPAAPPPPTATSADAAAADQPSPGPRAGEDKRATEQPPATTPSPPQPAASTAHAYALAAAAGLGPAMGFHIAPEGTFQGRAFLSLAYGPGEVEVGAEATLPTTLVQERGEGFRQQLILGTLAACAQRWSLHLCALGKLGLIRAQGLGVDKTASPVGFLAQTGGRILYGVPLGARLAVSAHVDLLYLVTPWTVDVNHVATWTMPRFGAVSGIDVGVRFR